MIFLIVGLLMIEKILCDSERIRFSANERKKKKVGAFLEGAFLEESLFYLNILFKENCFYVFSIYSVLFFLIMSYFAFPG